MNLAGNINTELRQTIRPELCTQAWCKFYEIVSTYDIFNKISQNLVEAPKRFPLALNIQISFQTNH
jgi:cap2 methyltransferase